MAVMLLSIATIVLAGIGSIKAALVVSGFATFGAVFTARLYCVKLQDRIIRSEMRVRLREVLDGELSERAEALIIPQLIGLRFASDAELPGLVAKVLDDNIKDGKAIKQLVTDWQGDYDRV